MVKDLKASLAAKASQLDLARAETLGQVQLTLEQHYPAQTRAKSLHNGVLKIITPSSAVASELRLRQVGLIKQLLEQTAHSHPIERLLVQIRTLD